VGAGICFGQVVQTQKCLYRTKNTQSGTGKMAGDCCRVENRIFRIRNSQLYAVKQERGNTRVGRVSCHPRTMKGYEGVSLTPLK